MLKFGDRVEFGLNKTGVVLSHIGNEYYSVDVDSAAERHREVLHINELKLWKPVKDGWCFDSNNGLVQIKGAGAYSGGYMAFNPFTKQTFACDISTLEPFYGKLPTFLEDQQAYTRSKIFELNGFVKAYNLERCESTYSKNDLTLPYTFDLLYDVKTMGELLEKVNKDKDIYESMAEYNLTESLIRSIVEPEKCRDTLGTVILENDPQKVLKLVQNNKDTQYVVVFDKMEAMLEITELLQNDKDNVKAYKAESIMTGIDLSNCVGIFYKLSEKNFHPQLFARFAKF